MENIGRLTIIAWISRTTKKKRGRGEEDDGFYYYCGREEEEINNNNKGKRVAKIKRGKKQL